jgi:hypothetical protein
VSIKSFFLDVTRVVFGPVTIMSSTYVTHAAAATTTTNDDGWEVREEGELP